jgi:small subunit ribosomal protein S17
MHHPGQSFTGIVVGTAMNKTIKVRLEKIKMHPTVLKPIKRHVNFLVHDEKEEAVIGDIVRIDSCRKISKRKAFALGEIVKPAARYISEDGKMYSQQQDYKKDRYEKFRTNTVASMIESHKRANDLIKKKLNKDL